MYDIYRNTPDLVISETTLYAFCPQMGFDGFFFARIDYDDKKHRLSDKRMELVWRGSETLGQATEIFTGVLYDGYGPPKGFCFDEGCDDQPVMVSSLCVVIACMFSYTWCARTHTHTHTHTPCIHTYT